MPNKEPSRNGSRLDRIERALEHLLESQAKITIS